MMEIDRKLWGVTPPETSIRRQRLRTVVTTIRMTPDLFCSSPV